MSGNDSTADSFADWVANLKNGDGEAQSKLFHRYFECMSRYSERRLTRASKRIAGGEDVALSAINSFINGVKADRFPKLQSDTDLWKLLVVISSRKAMRYNERQHAEKRGGGQVRGESVFMTPGDQSAQFALAEAAQAPEDFEQALEASAEELLARLDDESLKTIVLLKMQGLENDEVAKHLGCVPRTIRRKLELIRSCWEGSDEG